MNFMILFNGREYLVQPLPRGASPDTILENHSGCMFLAYASSPEDAKSKIEEDRGRHKVVWY